MLLSRRDTFSLESARSECLGGTEDRDRSGVEARARSSSAARKKQDSEDSLARRSAHALGSNRSLQRGKKQTKERLRQNAIYSLGATRLPTVSSHCLQGAPRNSPSGAWQALVLCLIHAGLSLEPVEGMDTLPAIHLLSWLIFNRSLHDTFTESISASERDH